ncbi:MAG: hypothetical protein D4R45_07770 [Planctomycetaceae bacterium]|nr:MAG: hypothetical protein D4R45_07770 [Planctomycetaceae bacterium]
MAFTLEDIKKMSPLRKALVICLVFLLFGYFYYIYFLEAMLDKKAKLTERLSSFNQEIVEKQIFARQIEKYRKEVDALKKNLHVALAKLPERKEIPGLLHSVSEAGRNVNLEFLLFEPMNEVPKEGFYAEIPVKVEATGSYHNIVTFFEKVGKLPRIMNITDVSIRTRENTKEKSKNDNLICSCIVKTYMFLEKEVKKNVAAAGRK